MRALVVYGTSEGQTQKVALFVANLLSGAGDRVTLLDVNQLPSTLDVAAFEAIIVAARVHSGSYPSAVVRFCRAHQAVLAARKTAFISVSMTARSASESDRGELDRYLQGFIRSAGWTPLIVHHAAGARLYLKHGPIGRWVLSIVDRHRLDPNRDHEFTDWGALRRFTEQFGSGARAAPESAPARGRPADLQDRRSQAAN